MASRKIREKARLIAAHLGSCPGCRLFRDSIEMPDLSSRIVHANAIADRARVWWLVRVALLLIAAFVMYDASRDVFFGTAGESAHAAKHLGSFTLAYGVGLGIPFLLSGLLASWLLERTGAYRRYGAWINRVAGVIMIAFGIAAIYMGFEGRSTVQENLRNEFIVGTGDKGKIYRLEGNPARAVINGRLTRAGERVDGELRVSFEGLSADRNQLIFVDADGAKIHRRF